MTKKTICVTGGGGYIGSWIVKYLLDNNYNVRTTVRSKKSDIYRHLTKKNLSPDSSGDLELYEADLLIPNSFGQAFSGCDIVIHSASPFIFTKKSNDPVNHLIKPAIMGTQNILESVNKIESIKSVILTSSILAISSLPSATKVFDESCWAYEANIKNSPYHLSKRLAEEKAWEMVETQNRWSLTVINPGFVMGPTLSTRSNDGSIGFMQDVLNGKYIVCPAISLPVVDVRDVAQAHLRVIEAHDNTMNQRYICASESIYIKEIGEILRDKYGERYRLPRYNLPKWCLYLILPFIPITRAVAKKMFGIPFKFSNVKIQRDLDVQFHPIKNTLYDMVESMIEFGLVNK